jgi:hypothetical protein
MKNLIITESERNRILGMHKSASSRHCLMEQSGVTSTPNGIVINGEGYTVQQDPKTKKYRIFVDGVDAAKKFNGGVDTILWKNYDTQDGAMSVIQQELSRSKNDDSEDVPDQGFDRGI